MRVRIGETPDVTSKPTEPRVRSADEIVGSRNLAADAALEETTERAPLLLVIEANPQTDNHSISVPMHLRDRKVVGATLGKTGAEGVLSQPLVLLHTDIIGTRAVLLRLKKGFNSITVTYR